ncbi:hypothetical protein I4U23_023203 [Adineta vaga]|nr:hypothetical protein I4U23_023203 [Adineta vaga]
MAWGFWDWIICNTLIGFAIFLCVALIMGFILWKFDAAFYSIVAKLFNIKRCVIDVNHRIITKNNAIDRANARMKKVGSFVSKLCSCCVKTIENPSVDKRVTGVPIGDMSSTLNEKFSTLVSPVPEFANAKKKKNDSNNSENDEQPDGKESLEEDDEENESNSCCWPSKVGVDKSKETKETKSSNMETDIAPDHVGHPEHEREILDVYGKYLILEKPRNKVLIFTITVTIIASVILAGFQTCFLANVTVYDDGPCPSFGTMECFFGGNHTYFQCTPDKSISLGSFAKTATCFRWIGRDITISDIMTQIGACTGLLVALGAVTEVFIRFLLFIFQQRLGVATGIRRVMEKTVGINRVTQPCNCCGHKLCCHFGILNLQLYERPWLIVLVIILYVSLPALVVASIILMIYFRISITALTYIVLTACIQICCLGLLWILFAEDEIGRVVPGAWRDVNDTFRSMGNSFHKASPILKKILPEEELEKLEDFFKNSFGEINMYAEKFKHIIEATKELSKEFPEELQKTIPVEKVQQLVQTARAIFSTTKNFPLQGSAEEIRARKAAEKSQDVGKTPRKS